MPGAAEAGLHLVDDEDDAVLVADPAQPAHELARRDDEAALALHRLDHDRRDVLGGDLRDERALERGERRRRVGAAVLVREGHAVDLRRERPEPRLVRVRLRGQRQREQRPAVEGALEGDDRRAASVYERANLTAFSTASVPALKNAAFAGPAIGASAMSRSASVT